MKEPSLLSKILNCIAGIVLVICSLVFVYGCIYSSPLADAFSIKEKASVESVNKSQEESVYVMRADVIDVRDGMITVEDTQGTLWELASDELSEDDIVLLYLADGGTQDNTDDVIVEVWKMVQ